MKINNYFFLLIFIILILFLKKIILFIQAYYFKFKNNVKAQSFMNYAFTFNEIFNKKQYDFDVKDNMTIFDIGANIGLFNLYVNSKSENVNVFSFEPVPNIFECLKFNTSKYKNSICINKGLGDSNQIVNMNYIPNASALSSIKNFDKNKLSAHDEIYQKECGIFQNICKSFLNEQMQNPIKIKTIITTVSNIIDKYQIKNIDVMKIDVEGFELNVLQGIRAEHFNIIKKIFIEIENFNNNDSKNRIFNIFKKYNYSYKIIEDNCNWITVKAIKK